MSNILYASDRVIPWETQSAFNMKHYNGTDDKNTAYCYMKGYVLCGDLKLCVYFFEQRPCGRDKLTAYIGLDPDKPQKVLICDFGYGGAGQAFFGENTLREDENPLEISSYQASDEQGYYWYSELTLKKRDIKKYFGCDIKEKSVITLNIVRHFADGHFGGLARPQNPADADPGKNMEKFTILNF